jgi:hypothetical protein
MATSVERRTDFGLGFSSLNDEVRPRRAAAERRDALLAERFAAAHRPGSFRGRRAEAAALVRRSGDAAPLHRRGRPGRIREPLPRRPSLAGGEEKGEIAYSEFATDPCRSLFKRAQAFFAPLSALSDNGNVNLTKLGERFVAMTETPLRSSSTPTRSPPPGSSPTRYPAT